MLDWFGGSRNMVGHFRQQTLDARSWPSQIIERRAPTDESVRLLREMEAAAKDQVDASIRLDVNGFKCVVHACRDFANAEVLIRVQFELAGKKRDRTVRCSNWNADEAAQAVRSAIVEEVSAAIGEIAIEPFAAAFSKAI